MKELSNAYCVLDVIKHPNKQFQQQRLNFLQHPISMFSVFLKSMIFKNCGVPEEAGF